MTKREPSCEADEHPQRGGRPLALPPEVYELAAELFQVMGDPARLRTLHLLADGEWCVSEIVAALGEKFPAVSQRLRLLHDKRLVRRRRAGVHVFYALADRHVADLIANSLDHVGEGKSAVEDHSREGTNLEESL